MSYFMNSKESLLLNVFTACVTLKHFSFAYIFLLLCTQPCMPQCRYGGQRSKVKGVHSLLALCGFQGNLAWQEAPLPAESHTDPAHKAFEGSSDWPSDLYPPTSGHAGVTGVKVTPGLCESSKQAALAR